MAMSIFIPAHEPPNTWDRILMHPFENVFALLGVVFGALIVASLLVPGVVPSESLDSLPCLLMWILAGLVTMGGVFSLIGLHWRGEKISSAWNFERLGWAGVFCGFFGYMYVIFFFYPGSIFSWLIPAVMCLGAGLRVIALNLIERATRRIVAQIKLEGRDEDGC